MIELRISLRTWHLAGAVLLALPQAASAQAPQPWPERQNQTERQDFLEKLRLWVADPAIELWFSDECGVEGDPRPRRRWVQPGQAP